MARGHRAGKTRLMPVSHIRPAGTSPVSVVDNDLRAGVLLVDNRDIVHLGLRVLLARQQWVTRVLSARRGADAVLLAERHRPRVAVVDLFVGSEYGVNICRAIRDRAPETRVLLTSSSTVLTQHAARLAGATGFVAKDTAATELLAAIRAVAHSNPRFVWRPAGAPRPPLPPPAVPLAQRLGLLSPTPPAEMQPPPLQRAA